MKRGTFDKIFFPPPPQRFRFIVPQERLVIGRTVSAMSPFVAMLSHRIQTNRRTMVGHEIGTGHKAPLSLFDN